ncbi:MAG: ABC transporter permease subunit [Leptospiraceae bacterium]|nr:ABC transporter permease subunit [Leptospiraceae bacterium]
MNYQIFNIIYYEFFENIRNKWLIGYALSFFVLSNLIFLSGSSNSAGTVASLLNLFLLIIPLFCLLFGSLSFVDSLLFFEMILIRPVSRFELYIGKWIGISLGLAIAFLVGIIPAAIVYVDINDNHFYLFVLLMLFSGFLHLIFISISFQLSVMLKTKEVILIVSLLVWFYFYILYDLIILGFSIQFGEYPLEVPVFTSILMNPLDLVRIIILIKMDIGALMGFSAAFFIKYLGGSLGIFISLLFMGLWCFVPLSVGYYLFHKRDM